MIEQTHARIAAMLDAGQDLAAISTIIGCRFADVVKVRAEQTPKEDILALSLDDYGVSEIVVSLLDKAGIHTGGDLLAVNVKTLLDSTMGRCIGPNRRDEVLVASVSSANSWKVGNAIG